MIMVTVLRLNLFKEADMFPGLMYCLRNTVMALVPYFDDYDEIVIATAACIHAGLNMLFQSMFEKVNT